MNFRKGWACAISNLSGMCGSHVSTQYTSSGRKFNQLPFRCPSIALPLVLSFNQAILRRMLSILLLAIFGLPLVSPLLTEGTTGSAGLHACCRRDGRHHCNGEVFANSGNGTQFTAPPMKCPYSPDAVVSAHVSPLALGASSVDLVTLASHPAGVAQTESKWRIARDRSRLKRGPPALTAA
jgi:hypothetical protein